MRTFGHLMLLSVCIFCAGCSSIRTVEHEGDANQVAGGKIRVPYYLPEGIVNMSVTLSLLDQQRFELEIASSITYQADPNTLKYAVFGNNWFFDDEISVQTDEQGLLMTVTGKSTDQSLSALTDTVTAMIKLYMATNQGVMSTPGRPVLRADLSFNPSDKAELEKAKKDLVAINKAISGLGAKPIELKLKLETSSNSRGLRGFTNKTGLHFRAFSFFEISGPDPDNTGLKKTHAVYQIPNKDLEYVVPVPRHAFVASNSELNITHGMLKGFTFDKKSEVAALPAALLKMAESLLSAFPKGILAYQETQNIESLKRDVELLKQQKALRDAEEALLEKEEKTEPAK